MSCQHIVLPTLRRSWYRADGRSHRSGKSVEPQLQAFGVGGLYLFGSYAGNEAGPDSDVDVVIDKRPGAELDLDAFMGAYDVLRGALPVNVDYGTRAGLSKFIRADVEREAIRIF